MLNILQSKMYALPKCILASNAFVTFCFAKMHLMPKCCVFCFAKNKDAALTFCLQNVRKRQNAFDAKMHFCVHFPLENVQRTFSKGKCSAEHFPKENVRKNAFDAKMHLMRTFCYTKCYKCIFASNAFYFVKCSASHFPKENVQHQQNVRIKCIFATHQQNVMLCFALQKYILASNTFSFGKCSAVQKCI